MSTPQRTLAMPKKTLSNYDEMVQLYNDGDITAEVRSDNMSLWPDN